MLKDNPLTQRLKNSLEIAWKEKWNPHKFDGENYYLWLPAFHDKKRVEGTATRARYVGYKARVIEVKDGYEVYIRK
jgi:hypothetical protein